MLAGARRTARGGHAMRRMLTTTTTMEARVGFVGLGNMGAHMARNLVKANHDVTVRKLRPGRTAQLAHVENAIRGYSVRKV